MSNSTALMQRVFELDGRYCLYKLSLLLIDHHMQSMVRTFRTDSFLHDGPITVRNLSCKRAVKCSMWSIRCKSTIILVLGPSHTIHGPLVDLLYLSVSTLYD